MFVSVANTPAGPFHPALTEVNIMNSDPSMYYEKAHKIAEQKYNYSEALLQYLNKVKKE